MGETTHVSFSEQLEHRILLLISSSCAFLENLLLWAASGQTLFVEQLSDFKLFVAAFKEPSFSFIDAHLTKLPVKRVSLHHENLLS